MIAYLQGTIKVKSAERCILLTSGGVGYEVFVTTPTAARLPDVEEEAALHINTVVREDALLLYGFSSEEERRLFSLLIAISKLGPKTALAVLSIFGPDDLRRIAAGDDPTPLTQVPGIGKKTAQHIFLELKYKLKSDEAPLSVSDSGVEAVSVYRDTLSGLKNLGYSEEEIGPVLEKILKKEPDLSVSEAIRAVLREKAVNTG